MATGVRTCDLTNRLESVLQSEAKDALTSIFEKETLPFHTPTHARSARSGSLISVEKDCPFVNNDFFFLSGHLGMNAEEDGRESRSIDVWAISAEESTKKKTPKTH